LVFLYNDNEGYALVLISMHYFCSKYHIDISFTVWRKFRMLVVSWMFLQKCSMP